MRQLATGLSATELQLALAELEHELEGLKVRDVVRLVGVDDLVIFMAGGQTSRALHLVPGSARGRVCTTARRWHRDAFSKGPLLARLTQELSGTSFQGSAQPSGERRCRLEFADPEKTLGIELELFGNRGFWALTDQGGHMLVLSRLASRAGSPMQKGTLYHPPEARVATKPDPEPRFASPSLAAIDSHFTAQDLERESLTELQRLARAVERGDKKLQARVLGLSRQREAMRTSGDLRRQADLLLTFGFSAEPSATELKVEDPSQPGNFLVIELEPGKSIQYQADRLYQQARKYQNGLPRCEARIKDLEAQIDQLWELRQIIAEPTGQDLVAIAVSLEGLGLLPAKASQQPARPRLKKIAKGENFRRAICSEGYHILIGRNNRQNDRLSKSIARGNDLWFHIGRGQAGSHVVLRLPKGKTASLESLLDAATLAVHYSKSRGSQIGEVVYTQAKYVTKPRGLAPGKVLADHTKSLRVELEPERLKRLLNSTDQGISHP